MLLMHWAWRAFSRAWAKTGKRMAARITMMAITTSSSINVNAGFRVLCMSLLHDRSHGRDFAHTGPNLPLLTVRSTHLGVFAAEIALRAPDPLRRGCFPLRLLYESTVTKS